MWMVSIPHNERKEGEREPASEKFRHPVYNRDEYLHAGQRCEKNVIKVVGFVMVS
jgi:hypothetical protein